MFQLITCYEHSIEGVYTRDKSTITTKKGKKNNGIRQTDFDLWN